jgi:thiol-disulfide isomerase/thioredoxin
MILRILAALLVFTIHAGPTARGQDAAGDLKALVDTIQAKLRAGQGSAAELAPELTAFDALRAKYRDQKTEEVARIAFMQATLFLQVLDEAEKGAALLRRIPADFPGTSVALNAGRALAALEEQARAGAAQSAVVGRPAPELHFEWSSPAGFTTLSALKGKVVVLDFWATWCGPCLSSFPQVRELTAHYAGAPVVVLGVTSIQGRVSNLESATIDTRGNPQKERDLMAAFIKAKDMTWPVVFSREEVFNPDFGVRGIPHMAIIAPDGTVRHNAMHPATPHAQKTAKIDAILREFGLPVPGEKKP